MDTRNKIEKLSDADFQMYLGIDRPTFYTALEILETENKLERKKGGTPLKTSIFERLVITLNYYREYSSLRHIAIDYGISKSNVDKIIHWTENVLIKMAHSVYRQNVNCIKQIQRRPCLLTLLK